MIILQRSVKGECISYCFDDDFVLDELQPSKLILDKVANFVLCKLKSLQNRVGYLDFPPISNKNNFTNHSQQNVTWQPQGIKIRSVIAVLVCDFRVYVKKIPIIINLKKSTSILG